MARSAQCNCEPCKRRRKAQQRWFEKNRKRRLKQNADWRAKQRRKRAAEPSDDELDRKALETLTWRQ